MNQSRLLEIVVGMFLCLGVAAILILTFQVSDLKTVGAGNSYTLYANFDNSGGLKAGSAVQIGGVTIGRVQTIELDQDTFETRVSMSISNDYMVLPRDSSASVRTSGLLGENYLAIEAGGDMKTLGDGDKFKFTESALVLEEVIGQFLFSKGDE